MFRILFRSMVPMSVLLATSALAQMPAQPLPIPQSLTGSVPTGNVEPGAISLTLLDAIERGVKYNIGVVGAGEDVRTARADRMRALSQLMPNVSARLSATGEQVDLASFGFTGFPGIPNVIGPFSFYDARASFTQNVLDLSLRKDLRARDQDEKASILTAADLREQVVLVVTGLYLQALAGSARIESATAQVATAETLLKNAQDRKDAGTSPAIDVLRAQVQAQALEQRRIYYEGEFQKQLLAVGRAIGLPLGQKITLTDKMLFDPLPPVSLDDLLKTAYANRRDYRSAQASLQAAELIKSAARAERYPTVDLSANYGATGITPNNSHGNFAISGGVNIPVFDGGRIAADELAADAAIRKRRAGLEDLRGRIDNEVRTSLIDAQNAYRLVSVARSNIDLARQQLAQSQDRFRAGVTNNVEVVQAQEAVASAEENLISSLFSFNVAKAVLVRAQGQAEQLIVTYLKGK
jgi:outer membrane protein TolC